MIQTCEEAIAWIHSRLPFGNRPGLVRVEALLQLLDHPEKAVETIHVAGTNGKGSTVSYLRALFEEAGLRVGTFTSPYIECFNERIAINGAFIPDDDLVRLVQQVKPLVAQLDQDEAVAGITEFELLTVLGFLYFREQAVDLVLVEVGLGGRLDSTNVITPLISVITTIGMDHTDILGDTLPKIAREKAGIIKKGVPVVTGNIVPEALAVIEEVAQQLHAPLMKFGEDYEVAYLGNDSQWGERFTFYSPRGKIADLQTPLFGQHQVENASLALQTYLVYCEQKGLPFQTKDIRRALPQTYWPARMEKMSDEPLILLDGAHNEHAMRRLVENLTTTFAQQKVYVLFSALETKDIREMLELLLDVPQLEIVLTTFDYPRAIQLDSVEHISERITIAPIWQAGLAELLEKVEEDDVLLVTGSLYFVAEVRRLLKTLGE